MPTYVLILTLRLWRRLLNPDVRNPLFRQTAEAITSLPVLPRWHISPRQRWLLLAAVLVVLFLVNPLLPLAILFVMPIATILGFTLLPFSLPLLVNVAGIWWAANAGGALARQQALRRYDLLSVSLDGNLNASWVIASACAQRGGLGLLHLAQRAVLWLGVGLLGALLLIALWMTFSQSDGLSLERLTLTMRTLMDLVMLLAGFHLHYMQTIILSLIAGMYVATHLNYPFEAQLSAGLVFVGAQVASYMAFGLVSMVLLAPLEPYLYTAHPLVYISLPCLYLVSFYLPREIFIVLLWHLLGERLNTYPVEREQLIYLPKS